MQEGRGRAGRARARRRADHRRQGRVAGIPERPGAAPHGGHHRPALRLPRAGQRQPQRSEEYNRLLDKARMDVARGIVKGNILTYAGLDPTKTADLVVSAFETATPNTMKGVRG